MKLIFKNIYHSKVLTDTVTRTQTKWKTGIVLLTLIINFLLDKFFNRFESINMIDYFSMLPFSSHLSGLNSKGFSKNRSRRDATYVLIF